jgi:predicted AlkP superfamily phosphohydrolase/phosphomutase
VTPCAWTSFKTGVNPGKHGIFDFYYLDENRQQRVNFNRFHEYKSIWRILSENGLRCCIYNVPFTFPPEKVNGVMISGLMTPSTRSNFTYPPDFREELLSAIPDYRISARARFSEREADARAYLEELFRLADMRNRTARYLLGREPWDFFMMVFNETDFVQHWFWKYIDPHHPDYCEEGRSRYGDSIFEIYRLMDEYIGRFLEFVDEDTLLLIMSDHGAGPFIKRIYINNWLKKRGYLKLRKTPGTLIKRILYKVGLHPQAVINLIFKLGLARIETKVSLNRKKSIFSKIGYTFDDIDWKRTTAFSFGSYGQIYLNSVENHPGGIVGVEEIPRIREEIVTGLKGIIDPDRGLHILDRVWYRDDIYQGPNRNLLPDITLSLDDFSYSSSTLFALPSNDIFSRPLTRKSGDHRIDGVVLAYGDRVKEGLVLENPGIMDITPTILDFFDLEVPREMDGIPLDEIFK